MFKNKLLLILSVIFLISIFFSGCSSNIYFLNDVKKKDLYTSSFMKKIELIKKNFSEGKNFLAISKLSNMPVSKLMPTERAFKENLLGVIYFGELKYEKALGHFEEAFSTSTLDKELSAQIQLNIGSTKYKLGFIQNVFNVLKDLDYKLLVSKEEKKYHKLRYLVSNLLDKKDDVIASLIYYFRRDMSLSDIKNDSLYSNLLKEFQKLDDKKAFNIFNDYSKESPYIIALLGIEKIKRYLITGKVGPRVDLAKWLKDEFSEDKNIVQLLEQVENDVDLDTKLNQFKIGVILPLTGNKKKYGIRALKAISFAFDKKLKEDGIAFELIIKNSESRPDFGALKVLELIKHDNVAAIIGGLSTKEAVAEYNKAKSFGALFLSLSSLYIPSIEKNHLLIELPGSIESQFDLIGSDRFQSVMGSKIAVMYPKYKKGEIFFDEVWSRKDLLGIQIENVSSFESKSLDFSTPVKRLLELNYKRERQEEFDLFSTFKEKDYKNWRTRQLLKPSINFDWVYVLSSARQAVQIIPSFPYFDARNVNIVGGPMWRSNTLIQQKNRHTNVYFIGDAYSSVVNLSNKVESKLNSDEYVSIDKKELSFDQQFEKSFSFYPRLLEHLMFEGVSILWSLLAQNEVKFETRYDLSQHLEERDQFSGAKGKSNWTKFNSLWTKKMYLYKLKNKKVIKVL